MATAVQAPPIATAPPDSSQVVLDEAFLARLERLSYLARLVVAGGLRGEKRSRRHGSSLEFADYRPYAKGDDLRRVDWKVFARTDRFYTKLFYEEEDLTVNLLLDCSASMSAGRPAKFGHAARIAAALGYIAMANMERVRYRIFADRLYKQDTGYLRSKAAVTKAFRFLEEQRVQPHARTDFAATCRTFAGQSRARGLVILVSDFLVEEGLFEGIKRLLHQGHQVLCFQVLSKEELEPEVRGELKLKDIETGAIREVTISPKLLKMYAAYRDAYLEQLETTCRRLGVGYLRTTTSEPLEDSVLKSLQLARIVRRG